MWGRLSPVNETEWVERLITAARHGTTIDLVGDRSDDPDDADIWDDERTIPASAIRTALLTKT